MIYCSIYSYRNGTLVFRHRRRRQLILIIIFMVKTINKPVGTFYNPATCYINSFYTP
jgi:hypothetical protein